MSFHDASATRRRGDWAELVAAAWLIEREWEVFKNVSAIGEVDLVAYPAAQGPAAAVFIDVKIAVVERRASDQELMRGGIPSRRKLQVRGGPLEPESQVLGIRRLLVTRDGVCGWDEDELSAKYEVLMDG